MSRFISFVDYIRYLSDRSRRRWYKEQYGVIGRLKALEFFSKKAKKP